MSSDDKFYTQTIYFYLQIFHPIVELIILCNIKEEEKIFDADFYHEAYVAKT